MAIGIAGDTVFPGATIQGVSAEEFMAIELRVMSLLTQTLLGANTSPLEELQQLRQDAAFQLGLTLPPLTNG